MIICSSQNEEKSRLISKLHLYRRQYGVPLDTAIYKKYLEKQFVNENQPSYQKLHDINSVPYFPASVVDPNGYENLFQYHHILVLHMLQVLCQAHFFKSSWNGEDIIYYSHG